MLLLRSCAAELVSYPRGGGGPPPYIIAGCGGGGGPPPCIIAGCGGGGGPPACIIGGCGGGGPSISEVEDPNGVRFFSGAVSCEGFPGFAVIVPPVCRGP